MVYMKDAAALRQPIPKPEKPRQNVVVHIWNKVTAPLAKRKIADSETTYQPAAKTDEERAAKIANMGRVPEIPAMSAEQIDEEKARAEGSKKLREARDREVARNQEIADSIKAAVNKNGGAK